MKTDMNRFALISGSLMCAIAVATGAFGAHALLDIVSPERIDTWQTGARYLMYHGIGLFAVGILSAVLKNPFKRPVTLLFSGATLFSLALFTLVLTNTAWLGAIAPIGGVLMILGWLGLAFSIIKLPRSEVLK